MILGHPVTLLWLSVISGYIIDATSWRWMFIIEGLPAIAYAFVFRALVDDRPDAADWLNPAERDQLDQRLDADDEASDGGPQLRQRDALKSRVVVVLAIQYALWSIGVYGIVFWLPTIVKTVSHAGIGTTGLLTAIPMRWPPCS